MSAPSHFLGALAQALSTMALYPAGHAARERAVDLAYQRLQPLLAHGPGPVFSFVANDVVYDGRPIRELRDWGPAARLTSLGIQRLEFPGTLSREDFEGFAEEIADRLTLGSSAEARTARQSAVRYGALGLRGEEKIAPLAGALPTATIAYTLSEEAAATRFIQAEVHEGRPIPLLEAEATVRALASAMHGGQQLVLPLATLKEFDEYTTTHSINVAVLAMALSESLGLSPGDVRAFGVAGLLHDIGKVCIPKDVLNKPGQLTKAEREVIQRHPRDGARLIMQSGQQLDLAASVAYEHHIMIDGCGYPAMHFRRDCHPASRIVHVCDVYDALRTRRPYRDSWEHDAIMRYLDERSGSEFDPVIVRAFATMMQQWRREVSRLDAATAA